MILFCCDVDGSRVVDDRVFYIGGICREIATNIIEINNNNSDIFINK